MTEPLQLYVLEGQQPNFPGILAFALTFSKDEAVTTAIKEYGGDPQDWKVVRSHPISPEEEKNL